jgi:hypothetical protein
VKIKYEEWNPREATLQLGLECVSIANRYQQQGYDLTVRQLYYQLVAAGRIPNTVQSYKTITVIIDRLRMSGRMDWFQIVDRTRGLAGNSHWDSPAQIVEASASSYRIDHWVGQPRRVEIWVEKEALAGVIGRVGRQQDIDYFSCRGYASTSSMWLAARRFLRYWNAGQTVTILHLGDHDPSGLDMTRDIQERLEKFLSVDWVRANRYRFEDDPLYVQYADVVRDLETCVGDRPLEIKRIALNMDQVEAYQPPPNPAKTTDSRYAAYQAEHGVESWELDALNPAILDQLITDEIDAIVDPVAREERRAEEAQERDILTQLTNRWDEVREFLETT